MQDHSINVTRRELQVLRLAAGGLSNGEIGVELGISRRTVEHHIQHALTRTGARSTRQLVAMVVGGSYH